MWEIELDVPFMLLNLVYKLNKIWVETKRGTYRHTDMGKTVFSDA